MFDATCSFIPGKPFMSEVSVGTAPMASRDVPIAARPLGLGTWIWISFFAVWIAGIAHEFAHIALGLTYRPASVVAAAAGPGATWAIVISACFILARRPQVTSEAGHSLAWVASLGFAGTSRFFLLAPGALTLLTGHSWGGRGDEYRVSRYLGMPQNALLFAELVLAVICVLFLAARFSPGFRQRALGRIAVGILLGWISWFAVAVVFQIGMMF